MSFIRYVFLLLHIFSCVNVTYAQLPDDLRSEQVFLGVAKTEWTMNDSIEVNGMVTCLMQDRMLPYSEYLYVELLDSSDSVIVRQKVRCQGAMFRAVVPTEAVCCEGVYYLRAYTQLMRNFSNESFALQPILVGRKFAERNDLGQHGVNCQICPQGGMLLNNHIQSMTALFTDSIGDAVRNAEVWLVNDVGDTVSVDSTSFSGLADISFIPMAGHSYRLALAGGYSFDVPPACDGKMKLQCVANVNKLKYEILNAEGSLSGCRLYIYCREIGVRRMENVSPSGIVVLDRMPRVVTMLLTDSADNVISEATSLAKYWSCRLPALADTVSTDELSAYVDSIGHTYRNSFVRVADAGQRWLPFAESDILYNSDYSSPLPFPNLMFGESQTKRLSDLQKWLNTATLKRFKMRDAVVKGVSMYKYMPETCMTIRGIVKTPDKQKFHGGVIVAYNMKTNKVYDADVDKDGRFCMGVDDFDDGDTFFMQVIDKRGKALRIGVEIDEDTIPAVGRHRKYEIEPLEDVYAEVSFSGTVKGRTLPNVLVKARKRHSVSASDRKFYSNRCVGRDKIEEKDYQTLVDILKDMPFLKVMRGESSDESMWKIMTNRGTSTLKGESLPILLDGSRIDRVQDDAVLNMPAFGIEEVEVLSAWQALSYTWGAVDGAILVTTRNGRDTGKVKSKGTYYTPMGLSAGRMPERKPVSSGCYRLLVDVVLPGGVTSYERSIVVVE